MLSVSEQFSLGYDQDNLLETLTSSYRRIMSNARMYWPDTIEEVQRIYELLRYHLMKEDNEDGFSEMYEYVLATYPDSSDLLL